MKCPYWIPKHCFCEHSQLNEKFRRNTGELFWGYWDWWNVHRFVRRVKVHFYRHQRLSLCPLVTSFLPAFLKYIYFGVEGLGDLGSMFLTFFLPPPIIKATSALLSWPTLLQGLSLHFNSLRLLASLCSITRLFCSCFRRGSKVIFRDWFCLCQQFI